MLFKNVNSPIRNESASPDNASPNNKSLRDSKIRLRLYQDILCRKENLFFYIEGDVMRIYGTEIIFEGEDAGFLKKFGLSEAIEMVLNYRAFNNLPFIYDTYQLARFLNTSRTVLFRLVKTSCKDCYKLITIKKKNGKDRTIHAPNTLLRSRQQIILREILSNLPVSKYATAYKTGAKLISNADPHVGKRYLLKIDITDFFGSIRFEQIYSAVFNTKLFPKNIGVMLTTLCCINDVLPQGAPTSPALSNLVMKNFDDSIGRWCEKRGISYTRYCDDITFSADKPLYAVYAKAKSMLENMGFELNESKTHFLTNACRQSVTGLTVNEKVAVSREYKRNLRQELYFVFKHGPTDSFRHIYGTKYIGTGCLNTVNYINSLLGKIHFVLSVEPNNAYFSEADKKLQKLILQFSD